MITADTSTQVVLPPEFLARIKAGAARAAGVSRLKDDLTNGAKKLRGTAQSSVYPDSLGDRMISCCLRIALATWYGPEMHRRDEYCAQAEQLLAEYSAFVGA